MSLSEKLLSNTISLFNSLSSLTSAQVGFKPSATSWSILECLEHLYLVDASIAKGITASATGKTENDKTELFGEGKLNHILVNKRAEFKVSAPDFAMPTGQFKTLEDAKQHIHGAIDTIILYLDSHQVEKETHTIKHHRMGEMTKTDWIHFLISHTNRHILQIEEVKKMAGATVE